MIRIPIKVYMKQGLWFIFHCLFSVYFIVSRWNRLIQTEFQFRRLNFFNFCVYSTIELRRVWDELSEQFHRLMRLARVYTVIGQKNVIRKTNRLLYKYGLLKGIYTWCFLQAIPGANLLIYQTPFWYMINNMVGYIFLLIFFYLNWIQFLYKNWFLKECCIFAEHPWFLFTKMMIMMIII